MAFLKPDRVPGVRPWKDVDKLPLCPLYEKESEGRCAQPSKFGPCNYRHTEGPKGPAKLERERIGVRLFNSLYGTEARPYKWAGGRAYFPWDPYFLSIICEGPRMYREKANLEQLAQRAYGSEPTSSVDGEAEDFSEPEVEEEPPLGPLDFSDDELEEPSIADYWTEDDKTTLKIRCNEDLNKENLEKVGLSKLLFDPRFEVTNEHIELLCTFPKICEHLTTFQAGWWFNSYNKVKSEVLLDFAGTCPRLAYLDIMGFPAIGTFAVLNILRSCRRLEFLRVVGAGDVLGQVHLGSIFSLIQHEKKLVPKLRFLALCNQEYDELDEKAGSDLTISRPKLVVWVAKSNEGPGLVWKRGRPEHADEDAIPEPLNTGSEFEDDDEDDDDDWDEPEYEDAPRPVPGYLPPHVRAIMGLKSTTTSTAP